MRTPASILSCVLQLCVCVSTCFTHASLAAVLFVCVSLSSARFCSVPCTTTLVNVSTFTVTRCMSPRCQCLRSVSLFVSGCILPSAFIVLASVHYFFQFLFLSCFFLSGCALAPYVFPHSRSHTVFSLSLSLCVYVLDYTNQMADKAPTNESTAEVIDLSGNSSLFQCVLVAPPLFFSPTQSLSLSCFIPFIRSSHLPFPRVSLPLKAGCCLCCHHLHCAIILSVM